MSEYEQIPLEENGRSSGVPLMLGQTEGADGEEKAVNPLLVIHNLMKGRYLWAIGLSIVLGGALGYVGYKIPVPLYKSEGMIRMRPYTQRILYQTEHNEMMPMFDSFVDSQIALMRSQRVTDLAMQSDEWKSLHRGMDAAGAGDFVKNLNVFRSTGSEIICVDFMDKDPAAAMIGARAVMEAYEKIYGENDYGSDAQRMQFLEDRRTALTNELKGYQDNIQSIGTEFGSDALEEVYSYKVGQLTKVETELNDAKLALIEMGVDPGAATQPAAVTAAEGAADDQGATIEPAKIAAVTPSATVAATTQTVAATQATTQVASTQAKKWTIEEIAEVDATMKSMISQRHDTERAIGMLLLHKNGDHKDVKDARAMLAQDDKDIQAYADAFVPPAPGSIGATAVTMTPAQKYADSKAKLERLQAHYDNLRAETLDLGRKSLKIKSLRENADSTRSKLDEVKARIEQLTVESSSSGRVTIVSNGDRPGSPTKDQRKEFAAAGVMGGGAFGIGLALLLGLMDRRLKSSIDTQSKQMRKVNMLGVLPHLPEDLMDSESGEFAANCVHGIRAALQVASGGERRAYAITSPASGDGKTSLVLALGMSFAASGAKTLLIDCDLIGGGLSHRVKNFAKVRLKTLLLMQGLVSKEQMRTASDHAKEAGITLNDALIQLGMLTQEQLNTAVQTEPERQVGLLDVLDGESLPSAVQGLGMPHLSVLTLGSAEAHHVGRLSPAKLRKIILNAKKHFDVVLVDTGPVLGSLEAVMVGGQVDQAVLVVSRGSQRELATRSLDRLQMAGARMAGLIFNRAEERDATHASSTSHPSIMSARSVSANGIVKMRALPAVRKKYERLGPLASVVAVSTSDDEKKDTDE